MIQQIPRIRLAFLPTPVEALPRLSAHLGGPKLLVKRDDQTGLAFGGNKTRKLEFLMAEAQAHGARKVITAGAAQSNHCRQTAAAAAKLGFACTLVLGGSLPDQPSANLLLDGLFGADVVWVGDGDRDQTLQRTFEKSWDAGERPYLIPYGGSNPVGAAGYAFAMQEMLEQGIRPDVIVVASSSGGTQAGMLAGARLFGYTGRILGIGIEKPEIGLQTERIANLAGEVCGLLGQPQPVSAQEVWLDESFVGGGYGVMGELEREAIGLFAGLEGLLVDPVYTGRAAGGLLHLIRQGKFTKNQTVLFWHTGGTPALFAERYRVSRLNFARIGIVL